MGDKDSNTTAIKKTFRYCAMVDAVFVDCQSKLSRAKLNF